MGRPSDARKRLIEAATAVVFAQSYTGVSVDTLCATAGVTKSSFYHFFSSKQELVLVAIESHALWFEQQVLQPSFLTKLSPQERILRFFSLVFEMQQAQQAISGHMRGCPAGNLTLEMSTMDEVIRERTERLFQAWLGYFEQALRAAQEQGSVPATLDIATTALALLAYFEGVMLLAKGRNDPTLIRTLHTGALALIHYQGPDPQELCPLPVD